MYILKSKKSRSIVKYMLRHLIFCIFVPSNIVSGLLIRRDAPCDAIGLEGSSCNLKGEILCCDEFNFLLCDGQFFDIFHCVDGTKCLLLDGKQQCGN